MIYLIVFCIIIIVALFAKSKKQKGNNKTICIIKTAFSSIDFANDFSRSFCDLKLIACANVYKCDSFYSWSGKVQKSDEYIVEVKTHQFLKDKVINNLRNYHQYKTPQIIHYKVKCNEEYYNWLCGVLNIAEIKTQKNGDKKNSKKIKTVSQDEQMQDKK